MTNASPLACSISAVWRPPHSLVADQTTLTVSALLLAVCWRCCVCRALSQSAVCCVWPPNKLATERARPRPPAHLAGRTRRNRSNCIRLCVRARPRPPSRLCASFACAPKCVPRSPGGRGARSRPPTFGCGVLRAACSGIRSNNK